MLFHSLNTGSNPVRGIFYIFMNFINNHYLQELFYRICYVFLSLLFCFFICYYKSDIYLTFITYPYLKLNSFKRLIALNIAELFYLSLHISSLVSLLFTYPFVFIQSYLFFCNAWFKTQIEDYKKSNLIFLFLFLLCFYFCYQILVPYISIFFIQFELEKHQGLLLLELEPRITNYVSWILPILFVIANTVPCIFWILFIIVQKSRRKLLLTSLINNRKNVLLFIFVILVLVVPIDFKWQLFLFFIFFFTFEFIIFICCWYK
uniref:SecY-independent transporter protein n=1 Tax=Sahlingia subintegra TaxID=468936 RepID=UPI001FCD9CB2|nr:SecY-independent transporter protein [Sahlingia subintegra]UNJ19065.1 SecY-independent transporter protein [Sahlingia subintegra]